MSVLPNILWGAASIGLFAGIWEVLWAIGWADPRLLPPPHIFIGAHQRAGQVLQHRQPLADRRGTGDTDEPLGRRVLYRGGYHRAGIRGAGDRRRAGGHDRRGDPVFSPVQPPDAADDYLVGAGVTDRMVAGGDLSVRHRQRAGDLHGGDRVAVPHGARHDQPDRPCQSQPDQRRADDGRVETADLHTGDHSGDPAAIVRHSAVQPVRGLDGRAGSRGDRRRLRPRPGDHAGAQHLQSFAGILHHRADRSVGIRFRPSHAPGTAQAAVLGADGHRGAAWPLIVSCRSPLAAPWYAAASARSGQPARRERTRLCSGSTSRSPRRSSSCCLARPAAASRRCCILWPGWRTQPAVSCGRSGNGLKTHRRNAA